MKIALVCPSNMMYMPYLENYEKVLRKHNINYEILLWDRFQIENSNQNENIFNDMKTGHSRNYYDYLRYKKFLMHRLNSNKYDKIIVFGLQLSYFLHNYLTKNFLYKYIIDIRDYNKIINFVNIKKIIDYSALTVISSPGYKKWLPSSDRLIVNHNTNIDSLEKLHKRNLMFNMDNIKIAYIGALRDCGINMKFINSLRNYNNFSLFYHGYGNINKNIAAFIYKKNIDNVYITGKYERDNELNLYLNSNLINLLIPYNDINSRTLMPNRLYNAMLIGNPVISIKGSYVADQIEKYSLGLVIKTFTNLHRQINEYLSIFNNRSYEIGRKLFIEKTINENEVFRQRLTNFATND